MLSELEKRALFSAVARFGLDRGKIELLLQKTQIAPAPEDTTAIVSALQDARLLSQSQAAEVLQSLDKTRIDFEVPSPVFNADGEFVFHPPLEFQEGHQLGEYRLLKKLGEGGMGEVFLGFQESKNLYVAIKILNPRHALQQPAVDRFYREAKSGALLNHPNIVRNLAVGQDRASGLHYLVMEFIDGPGADVLLEKQGQLSVRDACRMVLDIARGLEHAHSRNIVHRDIKPGNILVSASTGQAKLSDMGLAKRVDEASHLTAARMGFGTPYYMPYEQAINAKYADARSDIYALGATFYHLLTGQVPFAGNSHLDIVEKKKLGEYIPARALNPQIPDRLEGILTRMLAPEPRHRYQTAAELIQDLENTGLGALPLSFLSSQPRSEARANPSALEKTSLDPSTEITPQEGMKGLWHVRFTDEKGRHLHVRSSTEYIQKALKTGKFPSDAEVSLKSQGEYRRLEDWPEFQEFLGGSGKTSGFRKPGPWRKRAWMLAALGVIAVLVYVFLFLNR